MIVCHNPFIKTFRAELSGTDHTDVIFLTSGTRNSISSAIPLSMEEFYTIFILCTTFHVHMRHADRQKNGRA